MLKFFSHALLAIAGMIAVGLMFTVIALLPRRHAID